jgi:transcriptional regulator with XRE-family HTH domain
MQPFGDLIREWRSIRRFSQLDLSLEAETSARHVSFLESGRARPSRGMVLKLSEALQMPKAIANQALFAAGFSPAYPQLAEDAPDLAPIRAAIETVLKKHAPLPAIAIDQHWNIIAANGPALALFGALGLAGAANMIDALLLAAQTDAVENWEETSLLALARLRAEISQLGGDATLDALARKLAGHPRLAEADLGAIDLNQAVIPSVFNVAGRRLSMFSTIAQFGTVQDVAASEIRIEMMFPADEPTQRYFDGAQA